MNRGSYIKRGFKKKCPACGEVPLYIKFLKLFFSRAVRISLKSVKFIAGALIAEVDTIPRLLSIYQFHH